MNIENNFENFYNKFISQNKQIFDEMDNQRILAVSERKNTKKIIYIVELILLLIVIFTFAFIGFKEENEDITMFIFMICFVCSFTFPMIISLTKKTNINEYEKKYKEKIMTKLIESFDSSLKYYPESNIGCENYRKLNVEHFNKFLSSDVINGIYGNDEITISKVITEYKYYNHTSNSFIKKYETFEGLFTKIKLPSKTNFELYIKKKKILNDKLFNTFAADINQVIKSENTENYLETNYYNISIPNLNEYFNIYSSNLNCNIFDEDLIKILIDLYNTQKFEIAIIENYIYMRFWIDGLFSAPTIKNEVYDKDILYKNYLALYLVFYLLNEFKKRI